MLELALPLVLKVLVQQAFCKNKNKELQLKVTLIKSKHFFMVLNYLRVRKNSLLCFTPLCILAKIVTGFETKHSISSYMTHCKNVSIIKLPVLRLVSLQVFISLSLYILSETS